MADRNRRISIGPLIALVGAVLLLVSLLLNWWEDLTAFTVFEVLDLLLAALAVAAILAAADAVGARLGRGLRVDAGVLLPIAVVALVIVVSQLLNDPPAVAGSEADPDIGIWLALAGTLLMVAGSLLSFARISVALDLERREGGRPPRESAGPAGTGADPAVPGDRAPASVGEPPPQPSEAPTRSVPEQRRGGPERPA